MDNRNGLRYEEEQDDDDDDDEGQSSDWETASDTSLDEGSKIMLKNIFTYIWNNWPEDKRNCTTAMIQKVSEMSKISEFTIYPVLRECIESKPAKEKTTPLVTKLSDAEKSAIRKIAQSFYLNGDMPTLYRIYYAVMDDENLPNISTKTLRRVLQQLKFKYFVKGNSALMESQEVVLGRNHYGRNILEDRQEGRRIFFVGGVSVKMGAAKERMEQVKELKENNKAKELQTKENGKNSKPQKESVENAEQQKENLENAEPQKENVGNAEPQKESVENVEQQKESVGNAEPQKKSVGNSESTKENFENAEPQKKSVENKEPQKESVEKGESTKENFENAEPPNDDIENAETDGVKHNSTPKNTGKKKKLPKSLYVVHVGNENGFLENSALILESKDDRTKFENWFANLLDKLQPNDVIAMHRASYNDRLAEPIPSSEWSVQDIKHWLKSKNVFTDEECNDTSALSKIICLCKVEEVYRDHLVYVIEKMARAKGVKVLRMPKYFDEINPFVNIWPVVTNYVTEHMTPTSNISNIKELIMQGLEKVTQDKWKECIEKVKLEELEMRNLDYEEDNAIDDFIEIAQVSGCSSGSDISSEYSD